MAGRLFEIDKPLFSHDKTLMKFFGVKFEEATLFEPSDNVNKIKVLKDKGQ
jgi:hypothetical protein